jgi:hypothetical protein
MNSVENTKATKNDGGQAFPVPVAFTPLGHEVVGYEGQSLRDYFAAKALPALIAEMADVECDDIHARASGLASEAYIYADAMLAARGAA